MHRPKQKAGHQPTTPFGVGFCQRKTLQAGTGCGQAATAWPSVVAWLVFHSDTTAGSTRLLGWQGEQNIEHGTAAASLAPSTAEEPLPPSIPAPFPLGCEEKRKKKEEQNPPRQGDSNAPSYIFGNGAWLHCLRSFNSFPK